MANIRRSTIAVVRHDINDDRDAARAISFIGDLFVIHVAQFTRSLFDGTGDIVVGHIICLCLGNYIAQFGIVCRVAAALFYSNGDLTADLGENFAAL